MSRPEKPKTQKETIDQMWFVLIGANSEGIAERVKRIDERLVEVEKRIPDFMTHDQHREYEQDRKDDEKEQRIEDRRKKWRSTDVLLVVLMLLVTAVSALGAFV